MWGCWGHRGPCASWALQGAAEFGTCGVLQLAGAGSKATCAPWDAVLGAFRNTPLAG